MIGRAVDRLLQGGLRGAAVVSSAGFLDRAAPERDGTEVPRAIVVHPRNHGRGVLDPRPVARTEGRVPFMRLEGPTPVAWAGVFLDVRFGLLARLGAFRSHARVVGAVGGNEVDGERRAAGCGEGNASAQHAAEKSRHVDPSHGCPSWCRGSKRGGRRILGYLSDKTRKYHQARRLDRDTQKMFVAIAPQRGTPGFDSSHQHCCASTHRREGPRNSTHR